ncbi:serine/arginine repetitive matrix protein 1 isoform X2 [Episyrphus balteatus]|nr:serine/arginine repetitive matrix protein 1 isoform X2 [Episyrphus balteatus]
MKKARANTNDYWDKKLLEVEEKDPNRWRHTGYKKMYIQGESSSGESDREGNFRYNAGGAGPSGNTGGGGGNGAGSGPSGLNGRVGGPGMYHRQSRSPRSRSRSRLRKSPPLSPQMRRRSPIDHGGRRMSPPPMDRRPRSPEQGRRIMPPRSPPDMVGRGRPGGPRPRSPPEPLNNARRGKSPPRSPMVRRRSPGGMPPARRHSPVAGTSMPPNKRSQILPRSKRPPSPPPRNSCRSRSNSSVSSCSDDSCSVCSPKHHRQYSRSTSLSRSRPPGGPRSPPPKQGPRGPPMSRPPMQYRGVPPSTMPSSSRVRPSTPPQVRGEKYREEKLRRMSRERSRDMLIERPPPESSLQMARAARHSPPEDPRLKNRPPEPMEQVIPKKKKKDSNDKLVRARIKIEGEKRSKKHGSSSESDDSGSDSESSLPTFTATTRLTLSERFGKMAQWSIDRSNMENMRITKDSTGGALKVMIEEGLESPPRRYSYSPAPAGHFPEELATTAPSGMLSWDDVRVRYEYYKNRGYLRDLDLKDYIKWEEWWYKYQEWLKQERYYEFWERQQMHRRRRKKIPIAQRLN